MKTTTRFASLLFLPLLALLPASCADQEQTSELIQPARWWEVHPRPIYASLEKVGTYQEWFDVYRLGEGTFAIYEPNQFEEAISYLVLGEERGALIDAGTGIGDMRQVVEELTDLPVICVLTHEHYDHIGNAHRFDEIVAFDNEDSLIRLKQGRSNDSLQGYLTDEYLWKPLPVGFDRSTWTIPPLEPDSVVREGDNIDLGKRSLEVIYTPGHSPGSMCLLDAGNRILFTSDHFYPGPLYAHAADVDIDDYIASNEKIAARVAEYDRVCAGHNDPWVSSEVIPRVGQAFGLIFSGGGSYSEDSGLRRYTFEGFDVLIRTETINTRLTP
jgi:glyoxylase-like metal-dependent hydrolase (beta-lactamase superfamily II)